MDPYGFLILSIRSHPFSPEIRGADVVEERRGKSGNTAWEIHMMLCTRAIPYTRISTLVVGAKEVAREG